MHLIQILLPLYDNARRKFPHREYAQVANDLAERFGGITTYRRSPAAGLWKETPSMSTLHDDIVIYEVMTETVDTAWWQEYRKALSIRFRQGLLIVRASEITIL